MDIYDEILESANQLKKLIAQKADIRAAQTVQLRLQVLFNEEMERRKRLTSSSIPVKSPL